MFRQTNAYLVEESKMDRAAELLREEVLAREVQDTLDLVADGIIDLPASWAPAPVKLHGAEGDLTSNENKENKSDTVIYPGESITEIPTMKMRTAGIVDVLLSKTALIIESFLMNMETTNDQKEAAIYRSEALSISDFYRLSTAHPYRKIEDVEKGDKDFLKDFFKAFRGHIWKNNFAWVGIERDGNRPEMRVLESKAPLFFGVATSNNRVVGVDLCSNALQGPFPSSILNAKDMQVIRLSYNNIIGRLPRGVASLVHLEVLALAANRIQGPLEPQMFKPLKMLRVLDLSFNSITGSVPDVFDDMIHLRELNLAGNQLSGELPSSMANLTQLEYLKLYNNRLQGNLPRWIENMTKLLEINLSQNK
jgi:Leucine-rich repeat (LRR) protein